MKIIGKLLKKSTEIGYKRINRKNIDHQNQLTVLNSLLEKLQYQIRLKLISMSLS